jgi:hypothetical protein
VGHGVMQLACQPLALPQPHLLRPALFRAWLLVSLERVKKHAESVGELVAALATRTYSSDVAVASALVQGGLVLLVAGAVVALAGLVVIALADQRKRRRCAMDPQRCSVACHDLTSAPSLPSEPSQRVGGAKAA